MNVAPDDLKAHLSGGLKPVYVIHGEETLLKLEAADAIRAAARQAGFDEREHFVVEAHFDWSVVNAASDNLSLFASQRINEITINTAKPSADALAYFTQLGASPPADTLTIINLPKLERSATDSAWFTALGRIGTTIPALLVEREQLPRWVRQRLVGQGFDPDRDTVELICERCEGNLLAARQEVEKLSLLLPKGKLLVEHVMHAVADVARFDPQELSEAFLLGDLPRYERVLSGLQAEGEAAPRLSWQLAEDVHAVAAVMMALRGGVPMPQALRNARVWGKRQQAMQQAVKRISPKQISPLLQRCALLDGQSKGQAPGDPWLTLSGLALLAHGQLKLA